MRYFLGADLGGTKTHMVIADENGRAIGFGEGGPGNHQSVGFDGMFTALLSALEQALDGIAELREEYKRVFIFGSCIRYCQELVTLIEFDHMLDVAEVIVKGALLRQETRGSHFRTDFPTRDDANWLKHTLATHADKGPVFSYRAVKVDKYKPQERKY